MVHMNNNINILTNKQIFELLIVKSEYLKFERGNLHKGIREGG